MQPQQTQAAIHNPIAILVQSQHPCAIGERERPENIEPDMGPAPFPFSHCTRIQRLPTNTASYMGSHTFSTHLAPLKGGTPHGSWFYIVKTQSNTIPNPRAITTQSKNPTATQAEDLAEGYKELEIGLRCISNP